MKITCRLFQSAGDHLVVSSAIYSLKRLHPSVQVGVTGFAATDIYANNPDVTWNIGESRVIDMHNPLIHHSHIPYHFMHSYCHLLGQELNLPVSLVTNRPHVYLTQSEYRLPEHLQEDVRDKPYWIVCQPGAKDDYTVKYYRSSQLQKVIDFYAGSIQFVQVGESHHYHKPLNNVINLIGKTSIRDLIRLTANSQCLGVLTGESFLWHLAASVQKPAVCIASGFLNRWWINYPTGIILSKHGCLPCCQTKSCWKSRVVPLQDGSSKDSSLCELPVVDPTDPRNSVAKCMDMISPEEIIYAIESFYIGGVI